MSVLHWPLIGRDGDLRAIEAAYAARDCIGVVLRGPAGVGKSRLAHAFGDRAGNDGALVEWVQATRSAAAVPLAAVADLVPDAVRSDDAVALLRGSRQRLGERAAGRSAVVVVDDAHLLDPVSATLLQHLATTATAFVLATVREGELLPDAIGSLAKDGGARSVNLALLDAPAIRELVQAALGGPASEAVLRWVIDVSGGNALYVRELVSGAVDAGALVHQSGLWRLDGQPAASRSLIELVEERIGALEAPAREAIELLALGEPLRVDELASLTDDATVLAVEGRGLIVLHGADLGLAHPLYGEAVRRGLPPLRARSLRARLAATIRAREPFSVDDALRVARLGIDAGVAFSDELALAAGRAAIRSGDPELGAELAARVSGLPAALVLAQAHTARNRHADAEATLAAAEPLAAGDPAAPEFLRQRAEVLFWGLRDAAALTAFFGRARAWTPEAPWVESIERLQATYTSLSDGVSRPGTASTNASDAGRRGVAAAHALALLVAGEGDEAAAQAWPARPPVPLRDSGDSAALVATAMTALESGNRWAELEAYMGDCVRDGVRANDHEAAGVAAVTIAHLHILRGRYFDASRWLAEAEIHLSLQDRFGYIGLVDVLRAAVACFTRDPCRAPGVEDRFAEGGETTPLRRAARARGLGWATRMRSDADAGRRLLQDAAALADTPGLAAGVAYEALRAGAAAAPLLSRAADACTSRLVSAYVAHATASAARDGAGLLAAANAFRFIGADRYAVEAAREAAAVFARDGRQDSARRAGHLARSLHPDGQGGIPPQQDVLAEVAIALTRREQQLVDLARQGLSNPDIADRLVLSVRTVETHIYRAMQKIGVSDRRDL